VLLALAAASALGYAYFLSRVDWRWPTERFDVQKWKTSPKEARYVYCKDLKQSGILMNSTAAEVRALLGEPDYRSADGSYVTYIIKHRDASDIGMTAIYLLQLDFSATGRVQRAFLRAD
jgi:hypothetical protein